MGAHIIDGEFQSDKYPSTPRGKVPLSVKDPTAQDLLWQYAQRRRAVDAEFADDLEACLRAAGYEPTSSADREIVERIEAAAENHLSIVRQFDNVVAAAGRVAERIESAASKTERAADAISVAVRFAK